MQPHAVEGPEQQAGITAFACDRERPLRVLQVLWCTHRCGEQRHVGERPRVGRRRHIGGRRAWVREHRTEPRQAFWTRPRESHSGCRARRQLQCPLAIAGVSAPRECGSQIVDFGFGLLDVLPLAGRAWLVQERGQVACSGRGGGREPHPIRRTRRASPMRTAEPSPAAGNAFGPLVFSAITSDLSTSSVSSSKTWWRCR